MSGAQPQHVTAVPAGAAEHETHASVVRLCGDRAYKRRKAVRYPFLDQSDRAARNALAAEELAVNQTLAPGTYLGVRAVYGPPDGDWLVGPGGPGPDDEAVVEMRRFDQRDTLAARLRNGPVPEGLLDELGALLAGFHREATPATGGGASAALARVHRNAEDLIGLLGPRLGAGELAEVVRPLEAYCLREAGLLDTRARRGCWRDGHGDLRAEHVVFDRCGLQVVDRLEFDRRLRIDDVACDLAFLLMDLEAAGARWAADTVLRAYRGAGGDPGSASLIAFWSAYRATVTMKVALLRARQRGGEGAAGIAGERLRLARRLGWRTRRPRVLVVCGPPACGKSTLAAELHDVAGLPVLSSDRTRKRAFGLAPAQRAPAEAYVQAATLDVYHDLGTRAAGAAALHGGAVVDATMRTRTARQAFLTALGATGPVVFVQCEVPRQVALDRAAARQARGGAESDAGPAVAARLAERWEPLDEIAAADHLVLRADRPVAELVADLERALDRAS